MRHLTSALLLALLTSVAVPVSADDMGDNMGNDTERQRVWLDHGLQPVDEDDAVYYAYVPLPPVESEDGRARYQLHLYHPNDQLARDTLFTRPDPSEGFRDGPYRHYSPEGTLVAEGTFSRGSPHGPYKTWFPDGTLRREGQYEHGRRHGVQREWHDNGELRSEARYEYGRHTDGVYEVRDAEGRLERRHERLEGQIHGHDERFVEGRLIRRTPYQHGQRTGVAEIFDEDGNLRERYTLENGRRVGESRSWHANGTLRELRMTSDTGVLLRHEVFSEDGLPRSQMRLLQWDNGESLMLSSRYNTEGEPTLREAEQRDTRGRRVHRVEWRQRPDGSESTRVELLHTPHLEDIVALQYNQTLDAEGSLQQRRRALRAREGERWLLDGFQRTDNHMGGWEESHYRRGDRHGPYRFFDRSGEIISGGEYRNDQRHGTWQERDLHEQQTSWFHYENGQRHGDFYARNDDGQIVQRGRYERGELSGALEHFDNEGERTSYLYFRDGKLHGDVEDVDREGHHIRMTYYEGQRHGDYIKTQAAGFPLEIGQYEHGNAVGRHYHFGADGRLLWFTDYEDGVMVAHESAQTLRAEGRY